ncbi:MAG TPA: UvrD-helicase domain-containing protein [Bacteriovoracaceae bacterium]|nr:UvrD-helicase domain-containing protein [Bacteriovoracaceae bacterium]
MISLNGLNPEQREAAETVEGPVLILAGAGSGKTRTVTYRIAHMLVNLKIPGSSILAVSFTNKAASEMKERVSHLVDAKKRKGVTLSTFHSLGIRILREDIHHLGYNNLFTIYDQADQMSIVREGLKNYRSGKAFDRATIMSKIGLLKNQGISAEEFPTSKYYDPENNYDGAAEYVYHFYQDKLQFYNALDFDDILFLVVKLFKNFPEVAKKYSERFKFIMIDEYQDTNSLQFSMIQALTSTHQNICVVGDDDQAIYAFRGADISNILNFEKQYPNTKVVKLEENYRSTFPILDLANRVIKENIHRKEKTMRTSLMVGIKPQLWAAGDSDHEAAIVIEEIIKLQSHGAALSDIAILYRSSTQVPPFEDQLRISQVPYNIIGGQKFYEKKEIKDIIAYLTVIQNCRDELALRRILNVPNRGIGSVTLNKYLAIASERKGHLFHILAEVEDHEGIQSFVSIIKKYQRVFNEQSLLPSINALVEEVQYNDFIDKSYDSVKLSQRKKDDVKNFILAADRFQDRYHEDATLKNFVERLLLADAHDTQSSGDGFKKNEVTLMTLHASKGLEFDNIFLIGMEEEILPHKKTINDGTDINEERRLCYVGITRARKKLIMTFAKERKMYNKMIPRFKSRFVIELGECYKELDRTNFGDMSEDEVVDFKKSFFGNLLSSLK